MFSYKRLILGVCVSRVQEQGLDRSSPVSGRRLRAKSLSRSVARRAAGTAVGETAQGHAVGHRALARAPLTPLDGPRDRASGGAHGSISCAAETIHRSASSPRNADSPVPHIISYLLPEFVVHFQEESHAEPQRRTESRGAISGQDPVVLCASSLFSAALREFLFFVCTSNRRIWYHKNPASRRESRGNGTRKPLTPCETCSFVDSRGVRLIVPKRKPPGAWCAGRPERRSAGRAQGRVVTSVYEPLPL
jgi:hypothetical protein